MEKKGKVWLVGAGPSDMGLLTLKGKNLIEQADVVVYDALVSASILSMIPSSAQAIFVGKRAGNHPVPQEQINQILLEQAMQGKRVVRLKGGDPFLFGRGGEELELLIENGIDYEVVPGVTSAIAVPAYNGIPVTHRDYCSSVHIITAHSKKGGELKIDFEALCRLNGTLVFLMGVTAMPMICKGLLDAGMNPQMPAAILQQGTSAMQKKVVATISDLPEKAQQAQIQAPAVLVIGKVCALADHLGWTQKRALDGVRVILTRPKELISRMSTLFHVSKTNRSRQHLRISCPISGLPLPVRWGFGSSLISCRKTVSMSADFLTCALLSSDRAPAMSLQNTAFLQI